ncbi:MAG TPA: NAD(P)/FAD-dependent oxidoreductase [Chloroflexota bacterium]|nr:NAD(P)/FAD-dependent oxidoreductase [Chloroflexota bacterium]
MTQTHSDQDHSIVIAGAGYGGLHVAQRMAPFLRRHSDIRLMLVDQNPYHQLITELPRVTSGERTVGQVQVDLEQVLSTVVEFKQSEITAICPAENRLESTTGSIGYERLVLALGSRPNDFNIAGLSEQVLYPYTPEGAREVWEAVNNAVSAAAQAPDDAERRRLLTVAIGGGGASGVEIAGGFAEELPQLAIEHGLDPALVRVVLVEAGHTILGGSSAELIAKASQILQQLKVQVRTNAVIAEALPQGFRLKSGELVSAGTYVWAGGVKANPVVAGCGLQVGYNGRIKVDPYLRALGYVNIYVVGDLASVVDEETGLALPPLAQVALAEADSVAENLQAESEGGSLSPFSYRDRGFVVSVGRSGVAQIRGFAIGGRLAHALKDAIEWEYRQSVKRFGGRGAI